MTWLPVPCHRCIISQAVVTMLVAPWCVCPSTSHRQLTVNHFSRRAGRNKLCIACSRNVSCCVGVGSSQRHLKSPSDCWGKSLTKKKLTKMQAWAAHGQAPEIAHNVSRRLGKRKVVEHIVLFKTKAGFSEEQEKDMLDFLYTFQYHMRGIIAISLGRIINENTEGCTHALYMRFPSKEVLAQYYRNPVQSRVLNKYIIPYCHGSISVDYEGEVLDDIMAIFRRGEEFEYGVEFIVLISVHKDVPGNVIEDAFDAFANLIHDFGSTIIQHTQGTNFNGNSTGYTHGIMIRFPSEEALEIFTSSSSYMNIWKQKILPITSKTLVVFFVIDPVGTTIM